MTMRHRYRMSAATALTVLLPGLLVSVPALAYWELIPRVEGGITTETNPFNELETRGYDSATGAFADFASIALSGPHATPSRWYRNCAP
jgi:hypothetical protein